MTGALELPRCLLEAFPRISPDVRFKRLPSGLIVREKGNGERGLFQGRASVVGDDGLELWRGAWEDAFMPNALADEGEASLINVYLRELTNPTKYLGLLNDSSLAETDTVATVTESHTPGANGYSRLQLVAASWPAPALDSGDHQSAYPSLTFGAPFTATTTVTHTFITTTATGTGGLFVAYVPLSATTVIASGQQLNYVLRWKNQ